MTRQTSRAMSAPPVVWPINRRTRCHAGGVFLALTLAISAAMGPASAHASLVSASIKPGAVLTKAPLTLAALFAEAVTPKGSFLRVFEAAGDGAEVDLENSAVSFKNAKQITVSLPKKMPKGRYLVMWYTISADDGHRAGGSFAFTLK